MTHTSHTDTTSEHTSRRLSVKHRTLHSVARQRAMRSGCALGRSGGKLAGGALVGDGLHVQPKHRGITGTSTGNPFMAGSSRSSGATVGENLTGVE
jgi:hypothetical protein